MKVDSRPTVGVVLTSNEYPEKAVVKSEVYISPNLPKDIIVFHGADSGRVLTVVGRGRDAREKVYAVLENGEVSASNTTYRRDIAS